MMTRAPLLAALLLASGLAWADPPAVIEQNVSTGTLCVRQPSTISGTTITQGACNPLGINANSGFVPKINGATPSTNTHVFVSPYGNDGNDGLSLITPKLTLQAAVNAAGQNGRVEVLSGTFVLPANLVMQPRVTLACLPGAIITQAASANLTKLLDFDTATANGASVEGCTIDGNSANETLSANVFNLYIGNANDVRVVNNNVNNAPGYGLDVANGLRPVITGNIFNNFYTAGVSIIPSIPQNGTQSVIDSNRFRGVMGQHAIQIGSGDLNTIARNNITASISKGMVVNTSGTTVTWVSGPNFSTLAPGQFITVNAGVEVLILSIQSPTSLTVNAPLGTLTNTPAVGGPGDLISLVDTSFNVVADNHLSGGGAGGIVLSNFGLGPTTEAAQKNNIHDNTVTGSAAACISIQAIATTPASAVQHNKVQNNILTDCGQGTTAGDPLNRTGVGLFDFSGATTLIATIVSGNLMVDDQATPTMLHGRTLTGVSAGQVFNLGGDVILGTVNNP